MNLSRPTFQIKLSSFVALLVAGGCAPVVAEAPFAKRADTVVRGDLLGPFDGQILDAQSGKPLAGTIVQATWSFETGRGLTGPAGSAASTVATDGAGRYAIDRLGDLPSARSRITRVSLVAYQKGYVAYRSDRVFDEAGGARARTDFCQHNNVAKLDRWSSALSHVKHVRFVGGSGPLARAATSEVVEAALELAGEGKKRNVAEAPRGALLDAAPLLSVEELKAVTGYGGAFTIEKLADLATSESYDSRHFRAAGKAETFDAALRVWRLPLSSAEARYEKLLSTVPHAEPKDEVADRSLRGYDGRIVAVAALDRAHGVVIELTCGLDQCRDVEQAAALLRRIMARADRLGDGLPTAPAREETPEAEPAPARPQTSPPEKPDEDNPFQLRPPELKR